MWENLIREAEAEVSVCQTDLQPNKYTCMQCISEARVNALKEIYIILTSSGREGILRRLKQDMSRIYTSAPVIWPTEPSCPFQLNFFQTLELHSLNHGAWTNRRREQTCGCWGLGVCAGVDWEFGISRCKLLYTEWINNRCYCIAQGTIFNILW